MQSLDLPWVSAEEVCLSLKLSGVWIVVVGNDVSDVVMRLSSFVSTLSALVVTHAIIILILYVALAIVEYI